MLTVVLAVALGAAAVARAAGHHGFYACGAWNAIHPNYTVSGEVILMHENDMLYLKGTDMDVTPATGQPAWTGADAAIVVHLHNNTCDVNDGGPHWQKEVGGPVTTDNELWIGQSGMAGAGKITTFPASSVGNKLAVPHDSFMRGVVVHQKMADGSAPRLACCTLSQDQTLITTPSSAAGDAPGSGETPDSGETPTSDNTPAGDTPANDDPDCPSFTEGAEACCAKEGCLYCTAIGIPGGCRKECLSGTSDKCGAGTVHAALATVLALVLAALVM